MGDDYKELEQARHGAGRTQTGGSVFAFADGSARYLRFGQSSTRSIFGSWIPSSERRVRKRSDPQRRTPR